MGWKSRARRSPHLPLRGGAVVLGTPLKLDKRSSSPPAYENIENFVKCDTRESQRIVNGNHQRSISEPVKHTTCVRVNLPPTKTDVAALYAVPSTCRAAKNNSNLFQQEEVSTNGRHSDSDSTASSVDSQHVSLNSDALKYGLTNGKVKMRDGKKIPPPPPVRRTSTLSTQSSNQSTGSTGSTDENEKRKSVAELQQHFILEAEQQNDVHVVNGGVKSINSTNIQPNPQPTTQPNPQPTANGTIPSKRTTYKKLCGNWNILRNISLRYIHKKLFPTTFPTVRKDYVVLNENLLIIGLNLHASHIIVYFLPF